MQLAAHLAVGFVAALHVSIAVVEMFFWKSFRAYQGSDPLNFTQDEVDKVAPIVSNIGLYNAFLAAGLIWSFLTTGDAQTIRLFFLSCIVIAGIYGAVTISWTTLVIQSLPALLAMLLLWIKPT